MSQWTYVTGSIRGSMEATKANESKLAKALGQQLDSSGYKKIKYGSPEYQKFHRQWCRAFNRKTHHLPMGSEGSLRWITAKEPIDPETGRAFYDISFWGGLRDFGESQEDADFVIKWFQGVVWAYGLKTIPEMNALRDSDWEGWEDERTSPLSVEYGIMRVHRAGYFAQTVTMDEDTMSVRNSGFLEFAEEAMERGTLDIKTYEPMADGETGADLDDRIRPLTLSNLALKFDPIHNELGLYGEYKTPMTRTEQTLPPVISPSTGMSFMILLPSEFYRSWSTV